MKSNYRRLGDYVRPVDVRNKDLVSTELLGINIDKFFMPSVANIIGTDLRNYKLLNKGQFACNPMHVGRDEKLPIALYLNDTPAIVSPAYFVFEVIDSNLLCEYLMLWFRRLEFDRECWFYTDANVRGGISWEAICDMQLPIPEIAEQRRIVNAYNTIERRIELKRKINENLEEQAQAIFDDLYNHKEKMWTSCELSKLCKIKGGKRLPLNHELVEYKTKHPYIRVRDLTDKSILALNDDFVYITDETYNHINSYIVKTNDIIISIVGTIGLISIIDFSLDGANLTENCIRLTNIDTVLLNYIYFFINHIKLNRELEERTVGAVQSKLPIYNIESINVPLPDETLIEEFNFRTNAFLSMIRSNISELFILEKAKTDVLSNISNG